MQFHTTVSWSVLHSAPIGLVMWNHKSTWKERSVSVPKAMEEAFKEVSSVGIVVKIVQRWKCWKVFGVSARSGCTVLHPHSLKDAHFSKVHGIELLSLDCVLFYAEAMPPHLFHDQSYTEGPASQNAGCSLHKGKCIIACMVFPEQCRNDRKQRYVYFFTPSSSFPLLCYGLSMLHMICFISWESTVVWWDAETLHEYVQGPGNGIKNTPPDMQTCAREKVNA